jgi:hypothetical protein
MKKLSLTVFMGLALGLPAFGQSLDETHSCVIVYMKHDLTQPNLTIACDGDRVLAHTIQSEDKVENPVEFRAELFKEFQSMVNPSNRKVCNEYNYEHAWWASCLTKK